MGAPIEALAAGVCAIHDENYPLLLIGEGRFLVRRERLTNLIKGTGGTSE